MDIFGESSALVTIKHNNSLVYTTLHFVDTRSYCSWILSDISSDVYPSRPGESSWSTGQLTNVLHHNPAVSPQWTLWGFIVGPDLSRPFRREDFIIFGDKLCSSIKPNLHCCHIAFSEVKFHILLLTLYISRLHQWSLGFWPCLCRYHHI